MTVWTFLETLLIGPLKLVFEVVFDYACRVTNHPGTAIVFLSLVMNILVLPLYRRADAMQEAIRDTEAKLHRGVSHIKKTFSGDERMMILQTYYRQNHYKPTDALNGSVSLLLEIPFFLAAYQFLSHLEILKGVSFGPIRDLGAPDGLLVLGGITINLLPILMTLINVISSALYLKGFPMKTKIQLYAMALFFFVFLYSSPACLLFYWTLNNVFSLVKNIFYKLKNPQKILRILGAAAGLASIALGLFYYRTGFPKRRFFLICLGILLLLPLFQPYLQSIFRLPRAKSEAAPRPRFFLLGSLFLTLLVGIFIPSVFLAASPQEFVDITYFYHPLWYIAYSFCYAAGVFLVWMRVFYGLATPKGKVLFEHLIWILCGAMLADYMFFGTELGNLSASLIYDTGLFFSRRQQLFNLLILLALAAILYLFVSRWRQLTAFLLTVAMIALCGMSLKNAADVHSSVMELAALLDETNKEPRFQLSKKGRNVVVIMMDRAIGACVPYILNEKPELKDKFAGFTYYQNTVSFGGFTNFGVPALLGGYEYTPVEMNKRKTEPLVSKHNEALKMMPVLFSENGYDVTLCDPTYANYKWVPDLSIFDEYPGIQAYITNGHFSDPDIKKELISASNRNFFCFSVMKTMPLFLQGSVYDNGRYHKISSGSKDFTFPQEMSSLSTSTGLYNSFLTTYYALINLTNMTEITEAENNTYLYFSNDSTHAPTLLQTPDYVPAQVVDNTAYDAEHADRLQWNGRTLRLETEDQVKHYHANIASLLRLGEWFDYLRENDVYDNTRIILVSDHGQGLHQIDQLIIPTGKGKEVDVESYCPLLMVKDFDSQEFTISDDFMTNADVPTLATQDLIQNPTNPFTGKAINSDEKFAHEQFIILSDVFGTNTNNGNTFRRSKWASVKDNVWDKDNWTFYKKKAVLDQYAAP